MIKTSRTILIIYFVQPIKLKICIQDRKPLQKEKTLNYSTQKHLTPLQTHPNIHPVYDMCIVFDYQYQTCLHVKPSGVLAKFYNYRIFRECDGDEVKHIKRKGYCPECAKAMATAWKEAREAERLGHGGYHMGSR
jgi:hypothetical protein